MNKKLLVPIAIGGGIGVVALLMRGGSSGGGGGGVGGAQLDSLMSQIAKQFSDIEKQQKITTEALEKNQAATNAALEKNQAATNAALDKQQGVTASALQSLSAAMQKQSETNATDLQDQADELQSAITAMSQNQAATDAAQQQAIEWLSKLMQDTLAKLNASQTAVAPAPTPPAASSAPVAAWTRDNGPEAWLRSFGGLRSYGGPLSGPQGARWHSSDVWKVYKVLGRVPASVEEFIATARSSGLKPH